MNPAPSLDPRLLAAWLGPSPDLHAVVDAAGRLRWANAAFAARFGAAAATEGAALPGPLGALGETATEAEQELAIDGRRLTARARRVEGHTLWTLRDVTEARALAHEARQLRERLEIAQEFGRLGVWERDIASGVGQWDRHVFEFWGLDPSLGTPSLEAATQAIHPEDRFGGDYARTMWVPGRYAQHYRVMRPDGTVRRIHSQWEVKPGPDGQPQRVVGVMMDDTEVDELARSLGDASAQLKLAVELADIAIWRHDLRTNRMHYNDRAFKVLGIPVREGGMSLDEVRALIHPDDLPGVLESARIALDSDRPTDMEARYRRSDGSWRHVLTRRVVQRATDGTALAFIGVALDITDQVEQNRRAVELTRRLEIATESAQIGTWWRDPARGDGEWNAKMFELTGRDPARGTPSIDEWVGGIVHPADRQRMREAPRLMLERPAAMREHDFRIVRPDGAVRWLVTRARLEEWQGRPLVFGVTLDITDRRLADAALRSADQRAALAARGAGIGTWEVDLVAGLERWDEQMFRLRGLVPRTQPPSRAERVALVHPDDRLRVLDVNDPGYASALPAHYEFRVVWPSGEVRWLASRSVSIRDDGGRAIGRIGINWDVTDAKDAEAARQQTVVAERANQAKSEFLARISHELRTPLNAVLGFTQLLQIESAAAGDAAAGAKLEHIRGAGEHLLSLINDVLDLSSLEAGTLALELESVSLESVVAQALPLVAVLAEEARVQVRTEALPGAVRADRTRLLQVIVNLLTNAIKYNRRGGEVVLRSAAEGEALRLEVEDSGRGLSPEQLAKLFEPFNRLGAEREGIAGTGIGLTIVRALLHGMDGSIEVRSRPGAGSVFTVRLPAADAPQRPRPSPAEPSRTPPVPARARRRQGRVLYIEDNPVNLLLVDELVRQLPGLQLLTATEGGEGVVVAAAQRPDLVLVDMQLPDCDGFEVLRRLRARPETAALPCIALSANAMAEDIVRAREAGFDDYWTKPIDLNAVLRALEARFPDAAGTPA